MEQHAEAIDRAFARYCSTGDPGALGEVFDGTADRLLRVALWLCGNRADAEDALQRTFLMAIEARRRFEPGRKALPWLLGVLGNQVRKQRRERARRAPPRPVVPAADPAALAATAELQDAVARVDEQLGDAYRGMLTLHLQHGMAAHEIAAKLQR